MAKIKSLLIANRGEIARRIIRTCREMDIKSYVLYQEGEETYPHVLEAHHSLCLGGGELKDTYLNQELILEKVKEYKIDAIHPGYGFLSENPVFRRRVEKAGVFFIGPSADAMEIMGDKKSSKDFLEKHNIPLIPGYSGEKQEPKLLQTQANKIGYPMLVKATAGGGGKGMKVVSSEKDFLSCLESAKREALNAFGNDQVLLEKYLVDPRHIEVQIFGDNEGNIIHFFERDCSLQRRHQKVIEEAPAPRLKDSTRERLYEVARSIGEAVKYKNAGTLEFIVDQEENIYFLEMNTRLQVEHPISEMISGYDFVKLQIQIAEGKSLKDFENNRQPFGHALEVRVYAEDPYAGFLPTQGKFLWQPQECPRGIRIDFGYINGNKIGTNFDPMLGKIIAHGSNREEAKSRLITFLEGMEIQGIQTNKEFLLQMLKSIEFEKAQFTTQFLEKNSNLLELTYPEDIDMAFVLGLWELAPQRLVSEVYEGESQVVDMELKLPSWRLF